MSIYARRKGPPLNLHPCHKTVDRCRVSLPFCHTTDAAPAQWIHGWLRNSSFWKIKHIKSYRTNTADGALVERHISMSRMRNSQRADYRGWQMTSEYEASVDNDNVVSNKWWAAGNSGPTRFEDYDILLQLRHYHTGDAAWPMIRDLSASWKLSFN